MQSSAPDDGRKHRPKHVEPTWNNKLIYIVYLVGYFHSHNSYLRFKTQILLPSRESTFYTVGLQNSENL